MEYDDDRFIRALRNSGVEIVELTSDEEALYRREWFNRVVPAGKRQKAIESYCFDRDGCSGYLWHVFSYEILDCIKGNTAKKAFDSVSKQEAVLLVNLGNIASCRLNHISNITAEYFDVLEDVILTGSNFEWIYAKTHEPDCGPYFYTVS